MVTEPGVCEVYRQPDGFWRWRWVAPEAGVEPLYSAHSFPGESEAVESARAAFPGPPAPRVLEAGTGVRTQHRRRRRRRWLLAVVGALALVLAGRRSARRE